MEKRRNEGADRLKPEEAASSPDSDLQKVLRDLAGSLFEILGSRLESIILYGSAVFDDLAPGYGDLDFVAVVDGNLSRTDCTKLRSLRRVLRDGKHPVYAEMLEGAFLPRAMLDPAVTGSAFWWGTTGERPWKRNELGPVALYVIRARGRAVFGRDVRAEIPAPDREALFGDIRKFCETARAFSRETTLHTVDWLLMAARFLVFVREERLTSKSEAADWAVRNAQGDWRFFLPKARDVRLNPSQADGADVKEWLTSLAGPINDACAELERAMSGQGAA